MPAAESPVPDPAHPAPAPGNQKAGDLFPKNDEEHKKLLDQVVDWFTAAENHRKPLEARWRQHYRDYRSYKEKRKKGDWRSRLHLPMAFYTVETILPKLIAQPPQFLLEPVGPEDEDPGELLENQMKWATKVSRLYPQMVFAYKSALKYGTGVLKVFADRRTTTRYIQAPKVEKVPHTELMPVPDPDRPGEDLLDPDGNPVTETITTEVEQPVLDENTGQPVMETQEEEILIYQGPMAKAVDIRTLFPAPEASSVEDARYIIHRIVMGAEEFAAKVKSGMYRLPEGQPMEALWSQDEPEPHVQAQADIERGMPTDPTRDKVEILECWTKDRRLIAVANRRLVVRAERNPYNHKELPFCAIHDYPQEHEFWGVGEIEALADLPSGINSLWNLRIDNVKLAINRIFGVNIDKLYDQDDLELRPGRAIRTTGEMLPAEVFHPIEVPDVTSSSYTETAELERFSEKVSAVSAYQTGTDSPELNDTATGVALISEQGNTRHAMKSTMAGMDGLERLGRQFGSLLQQFFPDEMAIRRWEAAEDQEKWLRVKNSELQGAFDYTVDVQSMSITESIRREQAMALFNLFAGRVHPETGMPLANEDALFEDVLTAFGKKNVDRLRGLRQMPMPAGVPGAEGTIPGIGPEPVAAAPMNGGPA